MWQKSERRGKSEHVVKDIPRTISQRGCCDVWTSSASGQFQTKCGSQSTSAAPLFADKFLASADTAEWSPFGEAAEIPLDFACKGSVAVGQEQPLRIRELRPKRTKPAERGLWVVRRLDSLAF